MLSIFLIPGDLVCDWASIPAASDHRMILRSFINTMVWSGVAIAAALWISP